MNNLQKRILTSVIILPFSLFFILKGGYYLLFFLLTIFFIANYELFSVFKKISNILFLDLILIFALFSIFYLAEKSLWLLLWVIILVICSDVGGYVFGKIFKWKKLTKISPKKTVSGVLGSFLFALLSVFIIQLIIEILYPSSYLLKDNFLKPEFFFLAIVFSLVSQAGDLTISYFKRLEKIKDVGKILPGHGGIFDRIDGLIFVVIVTLVFYKLQFIPL
tara:strand:+ start:150 stop:809 length:660 start_codon:yes stop_codon:yes gene_type:complete